MENRSAEIIAGQDFSFLKIFCLDRNSIRNRFMWGNILKGKNKKKIDKTFLMSVDNISDDRIAGFGR